MPYVTLYNYPDESRHPEAGKKKNPNNYFKVGLPVVYEVKVNQQLGRFRLSPKT